MFKKLSVTGLVIFTFVFMPYASTLAFSKNESVYVVVGNDSSAHIKKAHIVSCGGSDCRVSWDDCSNFFSSCKEWVPAGDIFYLSANAQRERDKRDAEDPSFGEIITYGALLGFGAYLLTRPVKNP